MRASDAVQVAPSQPNLDKSGYAICLRIDASVIDAVTAQEAEDLARREALYRGTRPAPRVAGRIVILVDDGLATGATMRAATAALRAQHPMRLVVAVPTAAAEVCDEFRDEAMRSSAPRRRIKSSR